MRIDENNDLFREMNTGARVFLLIGLLAVVMGLLTFTLQWILSHRNKVYQLFDRAWRRVQKTGPMQSVITKYPRAWTFVGSRLTPGGYLGLHFTLGLLFSALALGAFGFVAYDVFRRDQLVRMDRTVVTALRAALPDFLEPLKVVTFFGNGTTIGVLALAIGAVLLIIKRRALLLAFFGAIIGAGLLESGLKLIFRRPRPSEALIDLPSSWSFPSGHALGSLVTYGMIAYLLWLWLHDSMRLRSAVVGLMAALVLAIGLSRIYFGVHYFSDVMGGFAAGTTWLVAVVSGLEVARRRRAQKLHKSIEDTSLDSV